MLSAQCDELRALAGDGSVEFVSEPVRARVLRDAADTIWELRDVAQDLQAENAKLRELVRDIADHIEHDDGFGIDCGWVLERIHEMEVDA